MIDNNSYYSSSDYSHIHYPFKEDLYAELKGGLNK